MHLLLESARAGEVPEPTPGLIAAGGEAGGASAAWAEHVERRGPHPEELRTFERSISTLSRFRFLLFPHDCLGGQNLVVDWNYDNLLLDIDIDIDTDIDIDIDIDIDTDIDIDIDIDTDIDNKLYSR